MSSVPPAVMEVKPERRMSSLTLGIKNLRSASSHHIKQIFTSENTQAIDLDIESFYEARAKKRTQNYQDVSELLQSTGVTDHDVGSATVHSPPDESENLLWQSKARGILMTLSPGEEYEHFQKVNEMLGKPQAFLSDEDDEEDVNIGKGLKATNQASGTDNNTRKLVKNISQKSTSQGNKGTTHRNAKNPKKFSRFAKHSILPMSLQSSRNLMNTRRHHEREVLLYGNTSKYMINPHSRTRLIWDMFSIAFMFYNAFDLPFQASFNPSSIRDDWLDSFFDVFFGIDILVSFNTAVEIEGSVRMNRSLTAKAYMRSWFLLDLMAAIPYSYIMTILGFNNIRLGSLLKLLRLIRLLRLFRFTRILRRIQNTIFIRSTFSSLLKYCILVTFVSHWTSCVFHGLAVSDDTGTNWVIKQNLQEPYATKWDRYVAALYFSVMTLATIGFGDVSGNNPSERLFAIFAMITGGGIFAYGITNIVELVSSLTVHETRFRQKMDEVNEYMSARELPLKLRMEIREFYHNTRLSKESRLNAEVKILSSLSSKLRSKVALSINDQFLRKFPFFVGSDPNFLMELALNMRVIHFAPMEDVIVEGEIGNEMFFIFRGAVEVLRNNLKIGILGENQYFGELAILSSDNRRTATVRTLCFCELRMLSRGRFSEALRLFPAMQTKMAAVAKSRGLYTHQHAWITTSNNSDSDKKSPTIFKPTPIENLESSLSQSHPIVSNNSDRNTQNQDDSTGVPSSSQNNGLLSNEDLRNFIRKNSLKQLQSGALQYSYTPVPPKISRRLSPGRLQSMGGTDNPGISEGMANMLSDIVVQIEDANRKQEILLQRIAAIHKSIGGSTGVR